MGNAMRIVGDRLWNGLAGIGAFYILLVLMNLADWTLPIFGVK